LVSAACAHAPYDANVTEEMARRLLMDYLLLDMGNTAVKWCLAATHRQNLGPVHALAWPADGSVKALAKVIQTQVQEASFRKFGEKRSNGSNASDAFELVYCSVASSGKTQALVDALSKMLHCGSRRFQSQAKFEFNFDSPEQPGLSGLRLSKRSQASQVQGRKGRARAGLKLELVNGYKVAGQLGADRWAALIGFVTNPSLWVGLVKTRARRLGPVVLVSAGTATVMDWLWLEASDTTRTRRFYFEGGTLRPGYGLMAGGLLQATAGLGPQSPPTTRRAIEMGIAQAQVAGVLSQGHPSLIVVHGGFARQWKKDFNRLFARGELEGFGAQTNQPNRRKLPEPLYTQGLVLKGLRAWCDCPVQPLG
jgi:pantothenate kinase type III